MIETESGIIRYFEHRGFNPIKGTNGMVFLKSDSGIIIPHPNGTIEGFLKTNELDENILEESNFRKLTELIILITISVAYVTTDITIIMGNSMSPTYKSGEIVINSKIKSKVEDNLKRGTVIKFKSPEKDTAIKRIMGLPGDKVTIDFNRVYVNEELVDDENMEIDPKGAKKVPALTPKGHDRGFTKYQYDLNDGQYFVIGDNRPFSSDSRKYGPISKNSIISVVQR
jgi:signal peptidase I